MPIRLIVVAEHDLFVHAFGALFAQRPELVVVGVASSGGDAIALAAAARPDVAIVVAAPAEGVVAALAGACKVIVVGARNEVDARRALDAGARGVVARTQTSAELFSAVDAVVRGQTALPSWPASPPALFPTSQRLARLTPRERQVFEQLIQGDTNATIAKRLGISAKTVDTHRTHLMRKLGVHSAVQLVRFAARWDLLPLEPTPKSALA